MKGRYSARLAAVVGFYALLAFGALHAPIFHAATHLPVDPAFSVTDYYHFHWNYWWIRHVLATPGLSIYETDYVFAPFTSSLALHTLTPFWYPVWALVEPLATRAASSIGMTAVFFAAFVLNGAVFYAFLRAEGASAGWALVGGALIQQLPIMANSVGWTNINLLGWFWLPLLMLTWAQLVRTAATAAPRGRFARSLAWALLLGASVWAMLLTDLQYPLLGAFLLIPYGLAALWRRPRAVVLRSLALLLVGALIALGLLWFAGPLPYLIGYTGEGLSPTPAERAVTIAFPDCFLRRCERDVSLGALVLPGLLAALLLDLARRRNQPGQARPCAPRRWLWLALVPAPLILSAGAEVVIGGLTIPLPYRFLHEALGGMFRYPERFAAPAAIAAAAFIALTLTPRARGVGQRIGRIGLPAAALLLVLAEARLFRPLPLQPLPPAYAAHARMGEEPWRYVIVDVPTGGSSGEGYVGEPVYATAQFYGLTHGKRLVNGHISRVNTWHYMYMRTSDPMMAWLGGRRYLESEAVAAQMRERIPAWPIGYFVLHLRWIGREAPALVEIVGAFNAWDDLLCPPEVEADLIIYRTRWHPAGCAARTPPRDPIAGYRIDLGADDDVPYLGHGWHRAEDIFGTTLRWAGAAVLTAEPVDAPLEALLYVDVPPGAYRLALAAQAFHEPRQLVVFVNGMALGAPVQVEVSALETFAFEVPAAAIGTGQHVTIALAYDAALRPVDLGIAGDPRALSVAVESLVLEPLAP
ncbi:MAG: hypothetical protein SNJ59_16130 [Aggregatilineales bacterium]